MSGAGGNLAPGTYFRLRDIMFNFNVVGLTHLLWMLDFYQQQPLTKKTSDFVEQFGGGLSLANLGQAQLVETSGLSEIEKGYAENLLREAAKLAAELHLPSTKHRIETFNLHLRFSMSGEERRGVQERNQGSQRGAEP